MGVLYSRARIIRGRPPEWDAPRGRPVNEKNILTDARRVVKNPVGPRLAKLLVVVFALFALLCVNSVYLVSVTIL